MNRKESIGRLIWRLIYPLLILVGVEFVVELVGTLMYFLPKITSGELTDYSSEAISNLIMDYVNKYSIYLVSIRSVIVIPIFVLFFRGDIKLDKFYGRHVEYEKYNYAWLLLIIPAGMGAAIGFNGLVTLSGIEKYSNSYQQVAQVAYSSGLFFEIISAAVLAPIVEELLFRGLIYKRLRNHLGSIWCMIISAAIFGLIHGNIVQFVYAFLIGILFAYVYEKFKSIWAPIVFHMSANLIAILVTECLPKTMSLTIGLLMLVSVATLAVAFVALKIIDVKFDRQEISGD